MKHLTALVISIVLLSAALLAHGNNDHVRGVVTEISATSISVEVAPNVVKKLSVGDKTTFEKSGKKVQAADLKVGDRVVIDVPKGSTEAREVRVGAAHKKAL